MLLGRFENENSKVKGQHGFKRYHYRSNALEAVKRQLEDIGRKDKEVGDVNNMDTKSKRTESKKKLKKKKKRMFQMWKPESFSIV